MPNLTKTLVPSLLLLLLLALAPACGGDDRASGSPPVVSGLEMTPTTASVGEAATLRGTLHFEDPDGDVLELHSTITPPGGPSMTVPPAMVGGATGTLAGSVSVQLSVRFVTAGDHTVRVWLRDAQGNDSNEVQQLIAVTE